MTKTHPKSLTYLLQIAGWRSLAPLPWMQNFMSSTRVFSTWGRISISLKQQRIGKFNHDELLILNRCQDQSNQLHDAWIREVEILVDQVPMMAARSVSNSFDSSHIWQVNNFSAKLPLGKMLFNDPRISRSAFVFSKQLIPFSRQTEDITSQTAVKHWVRRSLFFRQHKPLLLTEWFLPDLMQRMQLSAQEQRRIVNISLGKHIPAN